MELPLEVVLSSSIKRKKPWPRFCWLGQEKESVFLLDDKRISEINMVSGQTKKKTPKLHPMLNRVVTMAASNNGVWLCGLLSSGELFLWNRDKDLLKTAAAALQVFHLVDAIKGCQGRLCLQVSGDGMHVILVAITGEVFLWECNDDMDLSMPRDSPIKGQWAQIVPQQETLLPCPQNKEASNHTIFVKTETLGFVCLSAFVFTSGKQLIITFLTIQWEESHFNVSCRYSVRWATKTYFMPHLTPPCQPVKSRGALVPAFSPDGRLLAIVLNQRQPMATMVLFVSTQNFVSTSSSLGGCGSKTNAIPSKYVRSYWVGGMSWSPDGLFLACVLKRGSLLILARLGGLLTLTSCGCSIDFGPAQFLPLHPLVTYRPPATAGKLDNSLSSSSLSACDIMRQRYSVTWHPRLLYFIVSDGYMATVLRVRGETSPALLLTTLLKDISNDLEKCGQILDQSQISMWKGLVSFLHMETTVKEFRQPVSCVANTAGSFFSSTTDGSTLPVFLQDQGTFGGTKELLEKVQSFFEEDSDVDGPAGSHMQEGGRLEFASMFDTLHALDTHTNISDDESGLSKTEKEIYHLHQELGKIQRRLITAWSFSLSLSMENRGHLLRSIVHCVLRFSALVVLLPDCRVGKISPSTSRWLLDLVKSLISFLPWDSYCSDGPRCLGLVVELCRGLVHLVLSRQPDKTGHCQISSNSLSTSILMVKSVSDSLDLTYSLQQRPVWTPVEETSSSQPQCWSSDIHYMPLLQREDISESWFQDSLPPSQPSSRLVGVWLWLYEISKKYRNELHTFKGCSGWEEEELKLSEIMSEIQTALQAAGQTRLDVPALLSHQAEELYLCGLYSSSSQLWRTQLWEQSQNVSLRSPSQQMRFCLALLYSLLSNYQLKEAQEFGENMAHTVLHKTGHHKDDNTACPLAANLPSMDIHCDAAVAVVQSLGRFMASYFTNQPLYILPPHNVAVLPPIHQPHGPSVGRLVVLCQEKVAGAVRQQHLSEWWSVDLTMDLLLLGSLLPEAVWFASHLGAWKMAASLSVAYSSFCRHRMDFTRVKKKELHLPTVLEPESIFQAELESLLGSKTGISFDSQQADSEDILTDPFEGDDWDLLQATLQEILTASVMAGVNVFTSHLSSLLDTARQLCSCLPLLVVSGLYLPSPPLYCPQPSPNTQDQTGTSGQIAEVAVRQKVSAVLQRVLLLFRSARCCHPAAQWYISSLRRARHVLFKIKKKYSDPSAHDEEKAFPEGLMKFVTRGGFFGRRMKKDSSMKPDAIQTITCFRELCGLCWMLHVRDQLSLSCRKYQAAKKQCQDDQVDVNAACVEALLWARRYLPFSHFLNAEEILQDVLLSLASELPPETVVAETLVHAFPEEEESVRVPLREKYNSLLRRINPCNVCDGENEEGGEVMMILIPDKRRQRKKHLKRLKRHLAQTELHLWDKVEEEEDRGSKHGLAVLKQLSMGTTLSTSTLTECDPRGLGNDGSTLQSTLTDMSDASKTRGKKGKAFDKENEKRNEVKVRNKGKSNDKKQQSELPVVGTWEFELEDEEYLNFLELFLSYVLEKEGTDGATPSEPPLLKAFCSELRKRELLSSTFDVLTNIHRHERIKRRSGRKCSPTDPLIFRAGSCLITSNLGTTFEAQCPEPSVSRTSSSTISALPGLRPGRQLGLFGLQHQRRALSEQNLQLGHSSQSFPTKAASSSCFGSSTVVEAGTDLQQVLDPELEAQFPELGRLLEWMLRWADRRILSGLHSKKKRRGEGFEAATDEGVVIRVKAFAPAVLTSLKLLERQYATLLGTDTSKTHIQVPQMQWIVAPAAPSEVDQKAERESSVDTGYPGSTHTPITGLDANLQQEDSNCPDEAEEQIFSSSALSNNRDPVCFGAQRRSSLAHLEDASEEDDQNPSECSEVASCAVNESLPEDVGTPDVSLKIADLEASVQDMTSSASLLAGMVSASSHQEPQDLSTEQYDKVHLSVSKSAQVLPPQTSHTHERPPLLRVGSSSAGGPSVSSALNEPNRRLGDDLFRLVQNINYMNLMEVLGASFSSLQLAQQSTAMTQSNTNPVPCVPSYQASNFTAEQTGLPLATAVSQSPHMDHPVQTHMNGRQDPTQITAPLSSAENPCLNISGSVNTQVTYQRLQPLSVQAESPSSFFKQGTNLIPSCQGLLTTANNKHAAPPTAATGEERSSQILGLKLLQLHDVVPQVPPTSRPQIPMNVHPPTIPSKSNLPVSSLQQEWKRSRCPDPKRGFDNYLPPDLPMRDSYPLFHSEGGYKLPLLPASQGLRLLQLQPTPQTTVNLPKISAPTPSRPVTLMSVPIGHTQSIKLLRLDPDQKMVIPTAAAAQVTHLIPVENIMGSKVGKTSAEESELQSLGEVPLPDSSKSRRKRRQRATQEGKMAVTFQPKELIDPVEELKDRAIPEPAVAKETSPEADTAFQYVSFDPSLTGQRLLDAAASTAAELHAFASTYKNPPECHDAFTNTDQVNQPRFVDKAVLAQTSSQLQLAENSRAVLESLIEIPQKMEENESHQRQFLSVSDLEGQMGLTGLETNDPPATSSPSPAELHAVASSVIQNGRPLSHPQSSSTILEDIQDSGTSEIQEEALPVSFSEPVKDEVTTGSNTVEPPESVVCRAIKTPGTISHTTSSTTPTVWFSSRLSQLDSQLAALQNIADSLEKDFDNSKLLVNSIHPFSQVSAPDVESVKPVKKTVRLSLPQEAWGPLPYTEPNICEDHDESREECGENHSSCRDSNFSFGHSLSAVDLQPYVTHFSLDLSGLSNIADENLGQSGLSDTAEILEGLVKEGYLSLSDLDLSTSYTAMHQSSTVETHLSNYTSAAWPDEERRELRSWMRKKRRERMSAFLKHRQSLRERESRPFTPSGTKKSSNVDKANIWRKREEKEKISLCTHYDQRVNEAFSLLGQFAQNASNMPEATPVGNVSLSSTDPTRGAERTHFESTKERVGVRSQSGQMRPHVRLWTAGAPRQPPTDYRKRLGIDRPVTSLPKDRMCQITKRGMLPDSKSHSKLPTGDQHLRRPLGDEGKSGFKMMRRLDGIAEKEKDVVSSDPKHELSNRVLSSTWVKGQAGDQAGASNMDWLDNLSDGGSSVLSKIDWDAIEKLAADEDS
ncbi:ciliogenesis and planar polarity effector 1 isoform X1 [Synchiropus splendidus]|uniref:ciliogenesis and planar polarity effector 1 isoform X1 n=1 Tax=Synchiropus splendidus TaxID=270530 RepID=UPI00237E498C|nr:ciliogenesis and planar polarity effector 1 isoform X1 [Synchiropus splendidus]